MNQAPTMPASWLEEEYIFWLYFPWGAEAGEFAPFGSDERWDTLHIAAEKRNELTNYATVADNLLRRGFR